MESEERNEETTDEQGTSQTDEPSTDQLDEDPAYSGDAPGGDIKGG